MVHVRTSRGFNSVIVALFFCSVNIVTSTGEEQTGPVRTRLRIDLLVPSCDEAIELETTLKNAYARLSPSVVRLYTHVDNQAPLTDQELAVAPSVSGVIIDRDGLILTCSHHQNAPGVSATIELASGKRIAGKFLGRFEKEHNKEQPLAIAPDLGLARITEPGKWPAVEVDDNERGAESLICMGIGYPASLKSGRPPLLRVGRTLPDLPGGPLIDVAISLHSGDSGGPLFDMGGRVIGIAAGSGPPSRYSSVFVLKEFRERLESGELITTKLAPGRRTLRARPPEQAIFIPSADLETEVLQVIKSVIRIKDGPHAIAMGLLVDDDGFAVTKASLVGSRDDWSCQLSFVVGEAIVRGRVVATSAEHDVALMKLEVKKSHAPEWSKKRPVVGTIIASPMMRTIGPLRFSVVGGDACDEPAKLDDIPQIPLAIKTGNSGEPVIQSSGFRSAEVDSYRELLQEGDVVTHLNGVITATSLDFGRIADQLVYAVSPDSPNAVNYQSPASGSYAGDWVSIGILRDATKRVVRIPKIHSATTTSVSWHSNPLSLRREGFREVFAHDGYLLPEECGGPVVDLTGHVVGLNIARADTTRTLAIPADVLQEIISGLRKKAQHATQK